MDMFLVLLLSALTASAIVPYARNILRGATKPRLVTWCTWGLLSAITSAAAFRDGQVPAGILAGIGAAGCAVILLLGWHKGIRQFGRLDIVCQIGALVGLGLWFTFDSPALAVITMTAIDLIGGIPTIIHSWKLPGEETWITYLLTGLAGFVTVVAAENWQVTAILMPAYLFLFNIILTAVIILRKKYAVSD